MAEPSIEVTGLGKRYLLGELHRDRLSETVSALFQTRRPPSSSGSGDHAPAGRHELWALRDVSFEVTPGEVLGVIGRNGSGKSTLLKILSGITDPTEGRARLEGRIASMLEVGTGFHPELTGRENIFLNGAILGMTRGEIRAQFDEIVQFAGVPEFIDTPVKRYSSGMYVRLAFAVAAHLKPEILLVDEVLAVGDIEFQRRCLGKMGEVTRTGRTILFVSHNMAAIKHLCGRCIWLDGGTIQESGPTTEVVEAYVHHCRQRAGAQSADQDGYVYRGDVEGDYGVAAVQFLDAAGDPVPAPRTWEPVRVRLHVVARKALPRGEIWVKFSTLVDQELTRCSTRAPGADSVEIDEGEHTIDCVIPHWPFTPGEYSMGVAIAIPGVSCIFNEDSLCAFETVPSPTYDAVPGIANRRNPIALTHEWEWGG